MTCAHPHPPRLGPSAPFFLTINASFCVLARACLLACACLLARACLLEGASLVIGCVYGQVVAELASLAARRVGRPAAGRAMSRDMIWALWRCRAMSPRAVGDVARHGPGALACSRVLAWSLDVTSTRRLGPSAFFLLSDQCFVLCSRM